jgi:DNA-binding protein YbaB
MMNECPDPATAFREIQATAALVRKRLAQIRGVGTAANGSIVATVDSAGHLRDLKLPRDASRFGDQLAAYILQATSAAEKDAGNKTVRAMRPLTGDDRVEAGLKVIRETLGTSEKQPVRPHKPMTEAEIQAADDAFYEQRNLYGGWTNKS